MDYLNVVLELSADAGSEIPERGYGRLATLDACIDYLVRQSHT
jgi:hypothetical protein